ncbi:hypothetical protein [Haladaptatus paucihalophilus]|uniref:Uncharacterized protein n=2 Tax=Haladaptatus paucihalophilus DX253 TaxID=797209 RepID=A0A1M6VT11_HALPU|nr:hypothetical protein [Haladaptatus paucihalophilus]SHK84436.1 hypothetical protein SAMN05444342_2373 [Haladaptatus paucihalophilus DX253]
MAETARFRFGRIEVDNANLPSPEVLHNNIDNQFRERSTKVVVEGEDPISLDEKGMNSYLSNGRGERDFCYFTYVSEKERSRVERQEDSDELVPTSDRSPVRPRVFYFDNGLYAYESQQGLAKAWIPQYIGKRTGTEIKSQPEIAFSQRTMFEFYEKWDDITLFRFGASDEELEEGDEFGKALNELAETVSSQEFRGSKNLKGLGMFDEAANKTEILALRGKKGDDFTTNILQSGTKEIKWDKPDVPNNELNGAQAEAMYQRLSPILRKIERDLNL